MRERHGFEFYDYGDFTNRGLESMVGDSIPSDPGSFDTYASVPRYGTNYYGLRGRLSVLSEAFSHDPFPRRVASTYDFVYELLSYVAEHAKEVVALGRESDAKVARWAQHTTTAPEIGLQSRMATTRTDAVRVEVLRPTSDTTASEPGMRRGMRRTGEVKEVRMPVRVTFDATLARKLPVAYAFDARTAATIRPSLALHGVALEQLDRNTSALVQAFAIDSVVKLPVFENTPRTRTTLRGTWTGGTRTLPAGTYIVRASQPLGLLAFYLLEPESDDGLAYWDFLDALLASGKEYPVLRVVDASMLRAHPARP